MSSSSIAPDDSRIIPAWSTGNFRNALQGKSPDKTGMTKREKMAGRIRLRMEERTIPTVAALEQLCEFRKDFLNDLMTNKKQSIGGASLETLAEVLDCDTAYLLSKQDRPRRAMVGTFDPDAPERTIVREAVNAEVRVEPGSIPQIDGRLGLGVRSDIEVVQIPLNGSAVWGVPVVDTWKIPEAILRRKVRGSVRSVHIVECEGDSMEPRINDGDFVFIDTSRREPSPPGIFALHDGFGETLKRLELIPNSDPPMVKIIPENDRHTTYERSLEEVTIIGRYICRLTMS